METVVHGYDAYLKYIRRERDEKKKEITRKVGLRRIPST
jgi:hypothetical protein